MLDRLRNCYLSLESPSLSERGVCQSLFSMSEIGFVIDSNVLVSGALFKRSICRQLYNYHRDFEWTRTKRLGGALL